MTIASDAPFAISLEDIDELTELETALVNVTSWDGMRAEFVYMTPERAGRILERNTSNRTPSIDRIRGLVEQIQNGQWDNNGASVVISADGILIDGQHRLYAIVESGQAQVILLVTGAGGETILTIDSGKVRTFKDYLEIQYPDKKDHASIASAVSLLSRWEQGVRAAALFGSRGGRSFRADNHAMSDFYVENRMHVDYIVQHTNRMGRKVAQWKGFKRALVIATHVLELIDRNDAEVFLEKVINGEGLEAGSPILAFRRQAERRRQGNESTPADMWLALLFKAWNAYREGDQVQNLSYRRGGAAPEAFPEPK
ncbi:hypothetical protein [Microbacterium sp. 77mftsu3.1]|uniref:hypothetical protein n=1 Tax=Microbacterium sp. 77mftsu3.1 TaxID=1761802 RepID=UPI00036A3D85|nr:hypothetical protein [Microbacterium sp. 77mftsu3.1]SDH55871.1 hypothetical protein SAMN04488590_3574 [Microbacterium sp. 77mftsu3.1]